MIYIYVILVLGGRMSKFDDSYIDLCKTILNDGVEVSNRTGINTIKIPSYNFNFDLSEEFPILQSKQTFYKNAIIEMLWIWQMQSNDVRDLHDRGVKIWDEWMIDDDGIYRIYDNTNSSDYDPDREVIVLDPLSAPLGEFNSNLKPRLDSDGKVMYAKSKIFGKNIVSAKYYGKGYAYTIGTAYGFITKRYKHTQNLINTLKNNKEDRRMVKSLWQDEFLRTAVLPSCVWSTEWDVTGDKLNLSVHQRSCDVPLGLPFNVTQYSCFLEMVAQVTGLVAGEINYSIKDAHIYVNQLKGIREQILRWDRYNRMKGMSISQLKNRYDYLSLILNSDKAILSDDERNNYESEYKIIDLILNPVKPELWLNPSVDDFFAFDNSRELKDIKVKKYKHLGKISMPIAQ